MKSFNRYIREQRILSSSELIMEGSIEKFSDLEWLNYYYCGSQYKNSYGGKYIDKCYGDDRYELENVPEESFKDQRAKLKTNKAISEIRSKKFKLRSGMFYAISFKYTASMDEFRKQAIEDENEKERKKAEEFRKAVDSADTTKYATDDKHIAKMKAYFNKRSDPERLVQSIKDDNKLVSRWIAAIKINWPEAVSTFGYEIERRKLLTKAEIVAYTEKYGVEGEKVDDTDMKRLDKKTQKIADSWISKSIFKWLETLPVEVEWLESFTNAKTQGGKDAMRRNGRAWSEGFVIKITKENGDTKTITFDVVTNEGGGLYGYCLDWQVISLKELKSRIESYIK